MLKTLCKETWTDNSAFGDISHTCKKTAYKEGLCREHYFEERIRKTSEKISKPQAEAQALLQVYGEQALVFGKLPPEAKMLKYQRIRDKIIALKNLISYYGSRKDV